MMNRDNKNDKVKYQQINEKKYVMELTQNKLEYC